MAARPKLFIVKSRDKWTSAGGLVVDRQGRIALVRERKSSASIWTLPKGRLEPGETLEECALREVHEESGVVARIVDYVGMDEGKRNFVHYFLMDAVRVEEPSDPRVEGVRFVELGRAEAMVSTARDRGVLRHARASGKAGAEKQRRRLRP